MVIDSSSEKDYCFTEKTKKLKTIKCPKCKGETLDSYYCINCGKKLKDFKRFEVRFAIHTIDKDATFNWEKIFNILSKNIEGDIANLFVKEVKPID